MPSSNALHEERPARLYDGVSAQDHAVSVVVQDGRIVVTPADGGPRPYGPLVWPIADSHRIADARNDRLTVGTQSAPDARLVIEDRSLRAEVSWRLSKSATPPTMRLAAIRWAVGLGAAVLLIVAAAGLATRYAAQLLPAGWGATLSDAMLAEMSSIHPACTGTAGVAALDRLAADMSATLAISAPRLVTVRWDLVNAFALPGGRVVLTSGLIAGSDRPEALAAVLAHEIGHVAHRDPLARILRGKLVDVAVAAVFGVSTDSRSAGAVAGFLLDNSYTRDQETAADSLAIAVLNHLDIDPEPGAGFFDTLAKRESGLGAIALLNSHPQSKERAAALRRRGTGSGAALTPKEWRAVKSMCD